MNVENKNLNNERLALFDIGKGIATCLVVLGHLLEQTFCVWKPLQRIIIFCHMPTFFFISGFFLFFSINKYPEKEILKRKTKQLIIPYICWSVVSLFANILFMPKNGPLYKIIVREFLNIFIYARSLWFLIILFLSQGIFLGLLLLSVHIRINKYCIFLLGWIMISLVTSSRYFSMYKFKWLFPFLIAGMFFAEYQDKFHNLSNWKIISFVFPILCLVFFNAAYYNAYLEFNYFNYKSILIGLVYYILSFLGIAFIFTLGALIDKIKLGKLFLSIGKYSMEIYVMHMFFIKFLVLPPRI